MNAVSRLSSHAIILLVLTSFSCAPSTYKEVYPTLLDGKYDSEFPYRGCSRQLEEIGNMIHMLNSVAYYKSYVVPEEAHLTTANLTDDIFDKIAGKPVYFQSSGAGTGTIISYRDNHAALLTCAHVVDFPDTLVTYYPGRDGRHGKFIQSVSLKERQSNYVAVLPEGGELDILVMDRTLDIAILGKKLQSTPEKRLPVFTYPVGKATELEWGTFVYLFGYPMGMKMVTKGTVSSPNKDKQGSFLLDAVFNRGFSGGLVLAIRDGVPNFELVGMVKINSGNTDYALVPQRDDEGTEYDPRVPYTGDMFVERRLNIRYGITQSIGIDAIIKFIHDNRETLLKKGYDLSAFGAKANG